MVSVIVPAYHSEKTIKRLLDSILRCIVLNSLDTAVARLPSQAKKESE